MIGPRTAQIPTSKPAYPGTDSLLDALHDATLAVRDRLGAELDRRGISAPMFWTLHHVVAEGPMNLRQVASACFVTSSNVSTAVEDLVRAGLVTRTRAKQDRRELVLSATSRGRAVHAEIWHRLGDLFSPAFRAVSRTDLSAALRVLQRFAESALEPRLPRVVEAR
jgi:DNA-binding MarR family transcriptional regulator